MYYGDSGIVLLVLILAFFFVKEKGMTPSGAKKG